MLILAQGAGIDTVADVMGIQVSIRNDTDEVVTAEVKGQDGKEISGWKLTIPVGDEKRLTTNCKIFPSWYHNDR
eukprot:1348721-Amorphochlora_amoeboformis.AAC.1